MTQYMLLLGGADIDKRSGNPRLAEEMMGRYMKWLQGLKAGGHYVSSQKLKDQTGARLSLRGGEVVEGPFLETKEAGGGLFIIQAPSLERAVQLARDCPVLDLQNGYIEVRVIEEVRPAG